MRLASPVSVLIGLTLAACPNDEPGGWEDFAGDGTETETDTGESTSEDEDSETETGDTTTGEPEEHPSLRYVVTTTTDALTLGIDLDDPLSVPPASTLLTGEIPVGLHGPTPWGTEVISHDGSIDQLGLTDLGDYTFTELASQEAMWMDEVFFSSAGTNAVMTIGQEPFGPTNELLWLEYDAEGQNTSSSVITPPLEENGSVLVLGRSPDAKWAAILVDVELDSVWELYALNTDPSPTAATYIDQMDFTGIPPTSVADLVWLHLDDTRITYRKEGMPGIYRPLAVDLAAMPVQRINLTPTLGHINSMVWSPDNTRVLVTTGGADGYRELYLVELSGPVTASAPLLISEPGANALAATGTDIDINRLGHGFDAFGRIWYAYTDSGLSEPASVGIKLVVVVDGDVISNNELTDAAPGLTIGDVVFDPAHQTLGYRSQSVNNSSIHTVDLSEPFTETLRIDQDFEHTDGAPEDFAKFVWSADGSRIVIVGVQNGMNTLHVGQLGDPTGATMEITLPDVEGSMGITLDHRPRLSPDAQQVILWYSVLDGRTGLVHAPLDGSAEGQIVLGLEYPLREGAWVQNIPE